jgi:hypothetical protein
LIINRFSKIRIILLAVQVLLPALLILLPAAASLSVPAMNPERVLDVYGPEIAGYYRNVEGMPAFAVDSEPLPDIRLRREDSPCNDLFLRENPEMEDECQKSRETIVFENMYHKRVQVHLLDGRINSIDFNIPLDDADPMQIRNVILLHGSLVVHDIVLEQYSRNHAKIFYFPMGAPRVEFDKKHNLLLTFGPDDYIRFMADDFRKTECRGFVWKPGSILYPNKTRAVPDIEYQGDQPYMATVNYSYPPLDGYLDLYRKSKKLGRIPTSFLYQKCKYQRAKPLFKDLGLLDYLKKMINEEGLENQYGPGVREYIETLCRKDYKR